MSHASGREQTAADPAPRGRGGRFLRTAAFVTIVVAGLKLAGSLLIPVIVAAFIAIVCVPAVRFLQTRRVPSGIAVVLVLVFVLGAILLAAVGVADSAGGFSDAWPSYEERLSGVVDGAAVWLEERGVDVAAFRRQEPLDPRAVLTAAGQAAGTAASVFSNVFLVLLVLVFMLLEASDLPAKLRAALGDPHADLGKFRQVGTQVCRYVGIKTAISLLTGVGWGIFLAIVGIEFPLLWGLLAFLFNFIPNIGSLLAAIPPVVLALIPAQAGGPVDLSTAGLVAGGSLAINQVIGNVIEPRVMGSRLGLSPLVVLLSLVFWSWMWGAAGMLLSVPLTMIVKILLENTEDFRAVAVLLGPAPAPAPAGETASPD